MKIILNLKSIRISQGKTQKDLARASGLSQAYISELESNTKSPTLATTEKLMNALNISLYELLTVEKRV
ncbi:helix-turn-helix domain-containing protein [Clostridium butyricum]